MALIKCRDCQKLISTDASYCIGCGAEITGMTEKRSAPLSFIENVGKVVVALFLIGLVMSVLTPAERSEPTTIPDSEKVQVSNWQYDKTYDEFRKQYTYTVCTTSLNTLDLKWLSGKKSIGHLCFMNSAKDGKRVALYIENSYFLCHFEPGCHVNVKFDDGQLLSFPYTIDGHGNDDTVYLNDYQGFVEAVKKSKQLTIEAEFYKVGAQLIKFDVSGFSDDNQNRITENNSDIETNKTLENDNGNGYTANQISQAHNLARKSHPDNIIHCDAPDCDFDIQPADIKTVPAKVSAEQNNIVKLIAEQVKSCWSPPAGVHSAKGLSVRVNLDIARDGTMKFVSFDGGQVSDPAWQAAADSARRAVIDPNCNPLSELPPADKYNVWQEMTLIFDAKNLGY